MDYSLWYKGVELALRLSLLILFVAIAVDFYKFSGQSQVVKEKKSIVETGSMMAFFLLYYVTTQQTSWTIEVSEPLKLILSVIGAVMVFVGAVLNAYGRKSLSHNWANHIKIYEHHELVQSGLYQYVRHPLYATIIFMFFGGCLVFRNILSTALVLVIFIPFMVYRARQEERLLESTFATYKAYRAQAGMFTPKLRRRRRPNDSN